jgi:hypothetical protein
MREHMSSIHTARQQHMLGHSMEIDLTPLTYDSADTSKPSSLGRLLNQFSDRFPYAAVRDLDPAVWEVFTDRNTTLSSFREFGSQLLWLSAQVTDAAMRDNWGLHQHVFEQGCRSCSTGDKCVDLLKEFDHHGVDWDKVECLSSPTVLLCSPHLRWMHSFSERARILSASLLALLAQKYKHSHLHRMPLR